MKIDHGMHKSTVSEAVKETNEYLSEFCKKSEAATPLKNKRIEIRVRHKKGRGGLFIGYHFYCYNTKTKKECHGPKTKELFEDIWKKFFKAKLRKKLKEEAQHSLSKKLDDPDDYQPLDMEIGTIPEKPQQSATDGQVEYDEKPKAPDHNRVWESFDAESLLEPNGLYILSSDCGAGKTTFLRHLQLEILQRTNFIPIFVDASDIERWKPEDACELAEKLAKRFKLKVPDDRVINFLIEAFKKNVILLVDGLDQIVGSGNEYQKLAKKILNLMDDNVIITSRPSAVVSLEGQGDIDFLRLKPFSRNIQKLYFGEQRYKRARELTVNCPDLIAIPMLAYMVRTLIEKGEDKDVKNRAGLYKKFIKHVLTEYRHGGIQLPTALQTSIRLKLQKISYKALAVKEHYTQRIPLTFCYKEKLLSQDLRDGQTEAERLTESGLVNLIVEMSEGNKGFFYFTHQSFQEYLAAEWAKDNPKEIENILDQMWHPKWKETIKFLAGRPEGEDFIKRIYSPGCKDNCIHSRLFLAAECCGELGEVCELEKEIFEQLKATVFERPTPFGWDGLVSVSQLNVPEAVDFLIDIATGATGRKTRRLEQVAKNLIPVISGKILPRHVGLCLDKLEAKRIVYEFVGGILGYLTEPAAQYIDRIIGLECSGRFYPRAKIRWEHLAEKLLPRHIDQIFSFLNSQSEEAVISTLKVLIWLARVCAGGPKRDVAPLLYDDFGEIVLQQHDINSLFLPRHIKMLIRCAENNTEVIQEGVYKVMASFAGKGVLLYRHVEWMVNKLKANDIRCWEGLFSRTDFFSYGLSLPQISQIITWLGDDKPCGQSGWAAILRHSAKRLQKEDLTKICSWLGSARTDIKEGALIILGEANAESIYEHLDKIINLIAADDQGLACYARKTLQKFAKHIEPEQWDKVLKAFSQIKHNFTYLSHFRAKDGVVQGYDPFWPLPRELIKKRIKSISGFLDSICSFKQKLGIELLGRLEDSLPKEYKTKIVGLLSQDKPDITEIALEALQLTHKRLSSTDIHKIINCLNSQDYSVIETTARCLMKVREQLLQDHVIRIIDFLENKDAAIGYNSLRILAEVPEKVLEKVPEEYAGKIIGALECRGGHREYIPPYVAKFANKFGPDHVAQLAYYICTGPIDLKVKAIETLREMEKADLGRILYEIPDDAFDEIIRCAAIPRAWQGDVARNLLVKAPRGLIRKHIEKIVKNYGKNPKGNGLWRLILKIQPEDLTKYTDLFDGLLEHQEAEIQLDALRILVHVAGKFKERYIKVAEKLLHNPDPLVQTSAYDFLKNKYQCYGLP